MIMLLWNGRWHEYFSKPMTMTLADTMSFVRLVVCWRCREVFHAALTSRTGRSWGSVSPPITTFGSGGISMIRLFHILRSEDSIRQ